MSRPPQDPVPPADEPEMLDRAGLEAAVVEAALGELRRVNRWLLGHGPVRRTLMPRLVAGPREQLLVDVGTGSGEVAAGLVRRAAAAGRRVRVVGVDRKLAHLLAGAGRRPPQLRVVADARDLPLRDGAVDWSLSTLFFHHFEAAANRRVLAEMRRVARRGAVVVDLRQSALARRLGPLLIAALGVGPITRHDGRVSLARAWPLAAVAALVEGQPVVELRRRFPFRFSLVLAGSGAGARPAAGVSTKQEWHQMARRLDAAQQRLIRLAEVAPERHRELPGVCGAWTIRQLLAHLEAWNVEILGNLRRLKGGEGEIQEHDVDEFNRRALRAREGWDWGTVTSRLRESQRDLGEHLRFCALQHRPPTPEEREWVEALVEHDRHHARQLEQWSPG